MAWLQHLQKVLSFGQTDQQTKTNSFRTKWHLLNMYNDLYDYSTCKKFFVALDRQINTQKPILLNKVKSTKFAWWFARLQHLQKVLHSFGLTDQQTKTNSSKQWNLLKLEVMQISCTYLCYKKCVFLLNHHLTWKQACIIR